MCDKITDLGTSGQFFFFVHYSDQTFLYLWVRMQRLTSESHVQVSSCEGTFKRQEQHRVQLEQRRLWNVKGQHERSCLIFSQEHWWRKQDTLQDLKKKKHSNKKCCSQRALLPPAGCRISNPCLWFLFVSLASSNKTEPDELSDAVQTPNRAKLRFVSSPSFPTPSRNSANKSSTKHGARLETVEADEVSVDGKVRSSSLIAKPCLVSVELSVWSPLVDLEKDKKKLHYTLKNRLKLEAGITCKQCHFCSKNADWQARKQQRNIKCEILMHIFAEVFIGLTCHCGVVGQDQSLSV